MCKARISERERITSETSIKLRLNLDGAGKVDVQTGWGFFDHMLNLLFFWAGMDLQLHCEGDLHIDAHHSVEDVGLALGAAFHEALGDCVGIARVGYGRVPMDEALAEATVDLSGRPWLVWRGEELLPPLIGGQEKDLWREFYKSLCATGLFNLHIAFLYGKNGHHLLESCAKSLGCALGVAVKRCGNSIRSTKGVL